MKNITIQAHGSKSEQCYVTTFQAPNAVYSAFKRGSYPRRWESVDFPLALDAQIASSGIRWGAYGDPSAIPSDLIASLSKGARITGYTHQWRQPYAQHLKETCMASVESTVDAIEAQAMGWRTFRVDHGGVPGAWQNEIVCPASDEGGNKADCQTCGLCCGASKLARKPSGIRHKWPHKGNGLVLWEGASAIDGSPIVAIVTGMRSRSANDKTGSMLQVWILRSDIAPHLAQKSGEDSAVCGDCPLRPYLIAKYKGGN